jgi:hypothetical protein
MAKNQVNPDGLTDNCYNTKLTTPNLYISCVSYDGIGNADTIQYNLNINTKGSSSEENNTFNIGSLGINYGDEDNMLINIGGYGYYGNTYNEIIDSGDNYIGLIGDIIFYSRVLNDIEKLRVVQYLEAKYFKFREPPV